MSYPKTTQECQDAILAVFKSLGALIIKKVPSRGFVTCEKQFRILQPMLAAMANDLGALPFALEITESDDAGKPVLNALAITRANQHHFTLLRLGKHLKVIGKQKVVGLGTGQPGQVEMSDLSTGTVILFRESNNAVTVFANGYTVGYFDLKTPHLEPAANSRLSRRAVDYESSILDHYYNCVRFWQRTDHWANRAKRRLRRKLGSAHKTELIFHFDLHHWLITNLRAQVWSHPKDTTHDELDIMILSPKGKTYIIEVKWAGESEGGTTYNLGTIEKGLKQLHTYLTKQPQTAHGTLVTYDGRDKTEFQKLVCIGGDQDEGCKRLDKCGGTDVPTRGSCMVLFLESKTASQQ